MPTTAKREPIRSTDPYLEWALLTRFSGLATRGRVQLLMECTEEKKNDLLANACISAAKADVQSEYVGAAFHKIGADKSDTYFYSVSAPSNILEQWRNDKHLTGVRVEFSSARTSPAEPASDFFIARPAEVELACDIELQRSNTNGSTDPPPLTGRVMVVIDDGLAFLHRAFRKKGGRSTRVRYFWDQDPARVAVEDQGEGEYEYEFKPDGTCRAYSESPWRPVKNFCYGRELDASTIDRLIAHVLSGRPESEIYRALRYERMRFDAAHGTHVADLAVGSSTPRRTQRSADVAGKDSTHIIMIQLPPATVRDTSGGGTAKHVLDALHYAFDKIDKNAAVVVNLSFGASGGPHDGSTLFERAMDTVIREQRKKRNFALVLPAGNHFDYGCHAAGCAEGGKPATLTWHVREEDPTESYCEIWLPSETPTDLEIRVTAPDRTTLVARPNKNAIDREARFAVVWVCEPAAGDRKQVVLVALAPTRANGPERRGLAPAGLWRIKISATCKVEFDAWIERDEPDLHAAFPSRQSFFVSNRPRLKADEDDVNTDSVKRAGTGNSIANGAETIVVGACYELSDDPTNYSPASMPTLCDGRVQWPDLLAPGDTCEAMSGIPAAGATSGLTVRLNGTSVAAPQVSRAIMNLFGRKNGPKRMASREIVAALVGNPLPRDGPSTPQMRDGLSRRGAGRLDTGIK